MNYFDPPDKTQSVSAKLPPRREFIGDVSQAIVFGQDCDRCNCGVFALIDINNHCRRCGREVRGSHD